MIRYPIAANTIGPEELDAARAVLESGRLTMGAEVEAFEAEFAAWTGARYAVMVNSGSSANLLAVDAMIRRTNGSTPWRSGDEVLVPALAWPTTVWPIAQLGLCPVLVDIDPKTLSIDLMTARRWMTRRTQGIFVTHVLGLAADAYKCLEFCRDNGVALIEDACESLGAHWESRHVGLFGRVGTFSTYFSHHLSTIEGGMLVTDNDGLRDDLVSLRSHGWTRERSDRAKWSDTYPGIDPRFLFATGGYNVRPTEIQAAIGRVQLRKLDAAIAAREKLAIAVRDALPTWLELIGADALPTSDGSLARTGRTVRRHSWMMLPFHVRGGLSARVVKRTLEDAGVETRPILAGNLARHPAVQQFEIRAGAAPVADEIMDHGFMVGCHPESSDALMAGLERVGAL